MNSYLNKHNLISVLVGIVLGSLAYNPFKSESNDNTHTKGLELVIDSLNADIRKTKLMVDSLTGKIYTRDSNIVLLKTRIDFYNVKLLEYDEEYKNIKSKYEKVNPNNLNVSDKYKFITKRYKD